VAYARQVIVEYFLPFKSRSGRDSSVSFPGVRIDSTRDGCCCALAF
jgi:hypothetical protein